MIPIKQIHITRFCAVHIERFIGRYFKYRPFFATNDMGERFSHIASTAGKKRDID